MLYAVVWQGLYVQNRLTDERADGRKSGRKKCLQCLFRQTQRRCIKAIHYTIIHFHSCINVWALNKFSCKKQCSFALYLISSGHQRVTNVFLWHMKNRPFDHIRLTNVRGICSESATHSSHVFVCLLDLILYVPVNNSSIMPDGTSWVEPVLSNG